MKRTKKLISLVSVLAFLLMALVPLTALASANTGIKAYTELGPTNAPYALTPPASPISAATASTTGQFYAHYPITLMGPANATWTVTPPAGVPANYKYGSWAGWDHDFDQLAADGAGKIENLCKVTVIDPAAGTASFNPPYPGTYTITAVTGTGAAATTQTATINVDWSMYGPDVANPAVTNPFTKGPELFAAGADAWLVYMIANPIAPVYNETTEPWHDPNFNDAQFWMASTTPFPQYRATKSGYVTDPALGGGLWVERRNNYEGVPLVNVTNAVDNTSNPIADGWWSSSDPNTGKIATEGAAGFTAVLQAAYNTGVAGTWYVAGGYDPPDLYASANKGSMSIWPYTVQITIDSISATVSSEPVVGGAVTSTLPADSVTLKAGAVEIPTTAYTATLTWLDTDAEGNGTQPAQAIVGNKSYVPQITVTLLNKDYLLEGGDAGASDASFTGTAKINAVNAVSVITNSTATSAATSVTLVGALGTAEDAVQPAAGPTINLTPAVQTIKAGTNASFTATTSGVSPGTQINWTVSDTTLGDEAIVVSPSSSDVSANGTSAATVTVPEGSKQTSVTLTATIAGTSQTASAQITVIPAGSTATSTPDAQPSATQSASPEPVPVPSRPTTPVTPSTPVASSPSAAPSASASSSAEPSASPSASASASATASAEPSSSPSTAPTTEPSTEPSAAPPVEIKPDAPDAPADVEVVTNPEGEGSILTGVPIGTQDESTTVESVASWIEAPEGGTVDLVDADGNPADPAAPVGTGMVIEVRDARGIVIQSTTVVVKGDVLGTGVMSLTQLVRVSEAMVGQVDLSGAYLDAADLNGDGQVTLTDLVLEARIFANTELNG